MRGDVRGVGGLRFNELERTDLGCPAVSGYTGDQGKGVFPWYPETKPLTSGSGLSKGFATRACGLFTNSS